MKRRRVAVVTGDELKAQEDVKHFVCAHCAMGVVKK